MRRISDLERTIPGSFGTLTLSLALVLLPVSHAGPVLARRARVLRDGCANYFGGTCKSVDWMRGRWGLGVALKRSARLRRS
jgi:hypothetical protein